MNRRNFVKAGLLTSVIPLTALQELNNSTGEKSFYEDGRSISITRHTDVIVCGGGPAGIAAAIASARTGARTTLIESNGFLGGVWTAGLLCNIIDYRNKDGIMKEIAGALDADDAQYTSKCYDPEVMKVLLDKMCMDAGVDMRFFTRVTAGYRNSNNRLETIITESFSGREAWKAKVFIDATGNGDLAAYSGCRFETGHPETGGIQAMSLMALLTGLDEYVLEENGFMKSKGRTSEDSKPRFYNEILRGGVDASYKRPTLFAIRPDLICMMANHEYDINPLDAQQMSKAMLDSRSEVHNIVNALRSLGGIWSNIRIVATGAQIGIREARRIQGLYTVTREDLLKGARFDDAVCRVTFTVDIHDSKNKAYGSHGVKVQPYDIPARSLVAKDIDGLMMAGRNISGDFYAHASYRVVGNAVPLGEAAGRIAAKAALSGVLPQQVIRKEYGV